MKTGEIMKLGLSQYLSENCDKMSPEIIKEIIKYNTFLDTFVSKCLRAARKQELRNVAAQGIAKKKVGQNVSRKTPVKTQNVPQISQNVSKKDTFKSVIEAHTQDERLREKLNDYVENRRELAYGNHKNKKAPLTILAFKSDLEQLRAHYGDDVERQMECVDESIRCGWGRFVYHEDDGRVLYTAKEQEAQRMLAADDKIREYLAQKKATINTTAEDLLF